MIKFGVIRSMKGHWALAWRFRNGFLEKISGINIF